MKNELKTIGQIADELNVKQWKLDYIIRKNQIQPTTRGGHLRLFDEQKINEIKTAVGA